MEMEFRDNNRRGRFLVIAGLILAVVAGGTAFYLVDQAQKNGGGAAAQTVPVVVAVKTIAARKTIEAADVAVRDVPADATNLNGVYSDPKKVIGLLAGVNILQGQPIYSNLLASETAGQDYTIIAPGESISPDSPYWRAISITATDDLAVGGTIQVGDHVDVFLTATIQVPLAVANGGRYTSDKSTKFIYNDLPVLARNGQIYVVKVPVATAEEISHLQATGTTQFSLALRPAEDTRVVDASKLGETTNLIIKRYGLPIPEVYPGSGAVATPAPSPSPSASPSPSPSTGP
jgi:Flp pilus assembly protein CpaB